jgi:hypothetical protein
LIFDFTIVDILDSIPMVLPPHLTKLRLIHLTSKFALAASIAREHLDEPNDPDYDPARDYDEARYFQKPLEDAGLNKPPKHDNQDARQDKTSTANLVHKNHLVSEYPVPVRHRG